MPTAAALVRAAHPEPTVAVTALATAVAASSGRGPVGTLLVAVTVLTGQLSIGWCNDVVDVRRDQAAGRADKPVATGAVRRRTVAIACLLALGACVPLSFANGAAAGVAHLLVVAGGWAYNLGLKRTPLSVVPYAVSFAALPVFVALGLPGAPSPRPWVVVAGGLLGVGAHFLNVVPDVEADRAAGVLGLPQRAGAVWSGRIGALLLATAAAVVTFGPGGRVPRWSLAGLALAVVLALLAGLPARAGSRRPFLLALGSAAVAVVLLVGRGSAIT